MTFIPEEGAKIKTGEYYGRTADGKAEMTLYENSHGEVWGSIVDEATGVIYNLHVDSAGVETITIQTQESFQEVDEEMTLFAPLESARRLDDEQGEDEDNVLDVMVAYTPAAECKAVDEEPGCERTDATRRAIRTEIELGMLEANEAISKSMQGGGVEFRLVHIMEINYQEVDFVTTLQEATLGGIEGLLERREEFHADLVSVWIAGNGCGLAWI